jgi:hypothetical protein
MIRVIRVLRFSLVISNSPRPKSFPPNILGYSGDLKGSQVQPASLIHVAWGDIGIQHYLCDFALQIKHKLWNNDRHLKKKWNPMKYSG